MIVHDFTKTEIDYLMEECNFTDREKDLFLLRTKDKSLVECMIELNMSLDGIKKLSRKVNKKILKSL